MKEFLLVLLTSLVAQAQQPQLDDSKVKARMADAARYLPKDKNAGIPSVMLDGNTCATGKVLADVNFSESGYKGHLYYCATESVVTVKCELDHVDVYNDCTTDIGGNQRCKHSSKRDQCRYSYGEVELQPSLDAMMKFLSQNAYNGPVAIWFDDTRVNKVGKNGLILSEVMKNGDPVAGSVKRYVEQEKPKAKKKGKSETQPSSDE